MFLPVADTHSSDIGSLNWEKLQQHVPGLILKMNINGGSRTFRFAFWVIYVPIGCRHPYTRYWQPLLGKTTVTCYMPHPENERQRSINNSQLRIFGDLRSN